MENGSQRWLVDLSTWDPTPQQFSYLVSSLPPYEHSVITRFAKIEDKKRALVSRLLQYSLVHEVLEIPFEEIRIERTIEGKPYLNNLTKGSWRYKSPNFNFNVSHCGNYVGIASEPVCLVGLDIVSSSRIARPGFILDFIRNFKPYFTSLEWRNILHTSNQDEALANFCRYWCLKEACVKALGAGMGYGLDRIEIHHLNWNDIFIYIDGLESREWKFRLFQLDDSHWASIVRGHPTRAVDSYRRTFQQIHLREEDFSSGLSLPFSDFTLCCVEQLIPVSKRDAYALLCDAR